MVEGLRQIRIVIGDRISRFRSLCQQFSEYEYLLSIPGFGPDVSSKVLGAVGDPFRFQNGQQVIKMAGLDLSAKRSGKKAESARPVISKKGKADLRYALYQAAFDCFDEESGFYGLLHEPIAGSGKGAGNQDQDAGEAVGQDVDHCLDVDEEEGAL